jgi:hypothetical protein
VRLGPIFVYESGTMMRSILYTLVFAIVAAIPSELPAQPSKRSEFPPEGATISDEIRIPLIFQAFGGEQKGISGGIEYNKYYSRRLHDIRHQTLFGEAVALPTSSIHVGFAYRSNPDLGVTNTGYMGSVGVVKMLGDFGLGAWGRLNRSELPDGGATVDDYEFGPQMAFWPNERVYVNERLVYRKIGAYRNADVTFDYSTEEFLQLRHHLTYIVGEDWDFTYAHDIEVRAGIHQNYHTNNFRMNNFFMFSQSSLFSLGPVAGFSLDYTVGNRTSVLTIPFGARVEFFFTSLSLLHAEVSYDLPTMKGQRAGQVVVQGSYSYRF